MKVPLEVKLLDSFNPKELQKCSNTTYILYE